MCNFLFLYYAFILKKDKRFNSQIDNYTDKYAGTFKLGLFFILIGGLCFGLYTLYKIYFK